MSFVVIRYRHFLTACVQWHAAGSLNGYVDDYGLALSRPGFVSGLTGFPAASVSCMAACAFI